MLSDLLRHPASLVFAVVIHAVLIVLLMFSFDWAPKPQSASNKPDVIKAVAVDASKVEAELEKLRAAEDRKKKQEQARINKLKRDADAARKKRAAEEKRIAALKKKRAAEEKKRKAEQQRLATLKKQQAEAEQQRKAEQQRLAKVESERKAAEAARKKAEEEKRRAEDARKKAEAEQRQREEQARKRALAEQLAAEEQARADAAAVSTINEYTALIKNKVSRNWLKPAGNIQGLRCKVSVRLIPGGEVVSAQVVKSSGNSVFDRSVESAVFKASPLPLPRDPAIAARMREIDFEFIPEG